MRDIIIIANFCAALDKPTNSRFTYLADLLCGDNDVELIGSNFSHDNKCRRECDTSRFPYKITLLDEPGYKKNISIARFLSHRIWGNHVYEYIKARKKPDVIYCAMPSLTVARHMGKFCNAHNIKFIIDIQDLWPEAFRMALNIPLFSHIAFLPFKIIANNAYKNADEICAVSLTYVDRALSNNKKNAKGHAVYLGTDLEKFDEAVKNNQSKKDNEKEIWVGYCGSLSDSYDINCVTDAIALLGNPKVRFIVMGDGYLKEKYEKHAREKRIEAVFTGMLPYNRMCEILSMCDIVVNPIKGHSAASIINKHGDYAAAGKPVINTQESNEYKELIEKYHMGFNCKNGDFYDVAEKIRILIDNPKLRKEMGDNGRKCAEERFDRRVAYAELIQSILC